MKKRWLYVLLVAVALVLLALIMSMFLGGERDVLPVAETSFSLNGEDYPLVPVLQDFVDRGWKRDKSIEQIGNYTEEEGPKNVVPTGYSLTNGESRISVYLNVDDCREGIQPNACRLRSMSFYGGNVDSFCLNGAELAKIDSSRIIELLGAPNKTDDKEQGIIYYYSIPDKGISEMSLAFPDTLEMVAQIFIVFNQKTGG